MDNSTLTVLLADLASGLVDWVLAENPEDLGGADAAQVCQTLVAGDKAPDGSYFQVRGRDSGATEIWFLGDGGPFSDPAAVVATVDRGGRVWVRGGDRADACIETAACW